MLTSNVCFGLPKNCVSDGHFPALVMDKWIFFSQVDNSWMELIKAIPDICHGRHGRRPCKFSLPGVNFSRLNAKNLPFYCIIWHTGCNATWCIIYLVTVCNLHNMSDLHNNFTQRCVVCDLILCTMCLIYAECVVVLHSVCSFALSV